MVLALARPEGAGSGQRAGLGLFLIPLPAPRLEAETTTGSTGSRTSWARGAMATGEVTLEGTEAELVGDLEQGFGQMTPMLNITRPPQRRPPRSPGCAGA